MTGRPTARHLPVLAAVVTGTTVWLSRSTRPIDDAAITFRYATRLATGSGLTYNDGEHVLGASSGLHVLLIAALRSAGMTAPTGATALGIVVAGACGALVAVIGHRLAGSSGAVLAVLLLLAGPFRTIASSGMESPLIVGLGLAAVLAASERRDVLTGVLLGLAVWAKLDGVAVAAAVLGVRWVIDRRPPWRAMTAALVTAAPWYLWATVVYGSPLPQSLTSKLSGKADEPGYALDPTWALRGIAVLLPALVVAGWFVVARRPATERRQMLTYSLAGWFVLHLAGASLLPLGSQFGWYLAALVAPVATLGAAGAVEVVADRRAGHHHPQQLALLAAALASVLIVGRSVIVDGDPSLRPTSTDRFTADGRNAGAWVAENRPDATVETCLGWVGFAALDNRIIDPCQLTTEAGAQPADVVVGPSDAVDARGRCELARFDQRQQAEPARPAIVVLEACERSGDGT